MNILRLPVLALIAFFPFCIASAATGLLDQAVALEKKGKLAEAIKIHEKIAKKAPSLRVPSYVTIGGIYGKMGKFEKEIEWCRKAIALDPRFANAYVNLGNAYIAKQDVTGAEQAFGKAHELDPRNPLVTYSLGLVAEAKGELPKAEGFYRKTTETKPDFIDAWVNLGVTLANQKRFKDAKEALEKAESLDPTATDIRSLLQKVEKDLTK
ncbi:MAG: tetratricopeptide repeat protein [Proteobacteria bacterium]|nr:tetratricopeptide repeat protein [Pseudomonadota bacterium]